MIPNALTIAGSDPSGGAGIQADLKTFSALGVFGTSVITALTAQNTVGVKGIHAVPVDFARLQLDTLFADVRIDAVKIGMLGTAELAAAVGHALTDHRPPRVVLDPVMVATSGDRLLDVDAVEAVTALIPQVGLITPNLAEAALLTGTDQATDLDGVRAQAHLLRERFGTAVLVKGGHLDGDQASDLLLDADGELVVTAPRVDTVNTHGTGCTLSSAIAARAAHGDDWRTAVQAAKSWLTGALEHADELSVGHGHGPVHHFHQLWESRSA